MDRRRSTAELRLPDDMLANVLGRLPPRSLVASRCVHKHWRSIIDARHLLRTDLLPLRLDGFFCNPLDLECCPSFFARPSTTRRITGCRLDFSDTLKGYPDIIDHCNGLLLLWESVWVDLPPFPEAKAMRMIHMEGGDLCPCFYLTYDPMVSTQDYEVFLIPTLYSNRDEDDGGRIKSLEQDLSEWPPSPYTTKVFSSKKWRWEERSLVRQGEPAGTIADMICSDKNER
nr:unnamed protein product [Digitaria exilis]